MSRTSEPCNTILVTPSLQHFVEIVRVPKAADHNEPLGPISTIAKVR
jgi:hypothetical protein